ncbi:MAG TPA: hypothetical protein VF541_23415 [Longimicrobium sp.]|jgi:hypothetical protein
MDQFQSFPIVDGTALPDQYRSVLKPGELMRDHGGRLRRLPRFFYEIPAWETALEGSFARRFETWEFLNVDFRETEVLRSRWPRYVPCAVALLALHLELLRARVGTYIHIAANGGYRSPSHRLSTHASTHCWGTAANIYRIGDDWLDNERAIRKYATVVRALLPAAYLRPYGTGVGEACDHLHLDLGYTLMVPHGVVGEEPAEDTDGPAGTGPD